MMELCEENRGEELLNVSVDIGNGQKGVLKVFEHDDLQIVVRNFFIKNNLTGVDEDAFLKRVNEFMEELIEEHKLVCQALAAMPNFTSPECQNFGERLYRKCMQEKEMKIVRSQMERIQKARRVQESLQDRPKIDKKSVSIVSNSLCKSLSTIKCQSSENDVSELRFSPKLKTISESAEKFKPTDEKPIQRRRTTDLKLIQSRKQNSPCKPQNISKRKSQGFDSAVSDTLRSQAILTITQHVKIGIDQTTGVKVFQPVQTQQVRDFGKIIVRHTETDKNEHSHSPVKFSALSTEESENVNKQKRYLEIFEKLKSGEKIDPDTVDLGKVTEKLAKVLEPLLEKMRKERIQMNFAEFALRMDLMIKNLGFVDRNTVLVEEKGRDRKAMHKQSLSMGSLKTLSSVHNSSRKYSDRDSDRDKLTPSQSKLKTAKLTPKRRT